MVECDFHTHSTASDGSFSPSEVVKKSFDKGVKYLALTDHDTLTGIDEAKNMAESLGMTFIPGIELSTSHNKETVHLLGFFKGDDYKDTELNNFLQELKDKRIRRAEEIVARLKKFNNIEIKVEDVLKNGKDTIARPHIAKTIIEAGYPYDYDYIFKNFIGDDCPAYIPANKMSTEEGISLLRKYNAKVFLAHPVLLKKISVNDILPLGIDGLEAVYALNTPDEEKKFRKFANKNNLLISCGSDSHGMEEDNGHGSLGSMSLDEESLEKFINSVK